jgi:hypothetical protein
MLNHFFALWFQSLRFLAYLLIRYQLNYAEDYMQLYRIFFIAWSRDWLTSQFAEIGLCPVKEY